jgi:hypothetical protein
LRSCRLVSKRDIKRIADNNVNNLRTTANPNPSLKEKKKEKTPWIKKSNRGRGDFLQATC